MHSLSQITWLGVLDIFIVAVVLYQFLVLVKGTRASQMLLGGGVVAILLFLARRGQLPLVQWLINNLLPYAFFALIVVFQAEIRHILAKIGRAIMLSSAGADSESYDDL